MITQVLMTMWLAAVETIDPNSVGVPAVKDPNAVLTNVTNTVYMVAGIVCVVVIIVAGFFYVTSAADASQVKRAKNAIIGACVGLIVILMAFTLTQFVIGRI